MINNEITTTKGMEQAQKQMEQAKNRMALEKKKANEERRRRENAHKYMIDDKGHWMAKQRKEYLRDENGERIPLIDKETGQQKVDKQNRKQWKCTTVPVNDWNSKENARLWREDLAKPTSCRSISDT